VILADGVIAAIRRDGGDLLLTAGDLHVYRDGLWSPMDDAVEQRLRVLIQQGADTLGEADTKILTAAWKRLNEHPALYRAYVDWDAPRKICLTNGVLDLASRTFSPWAPEHYLRRKLGVAYDPKATAPQIVRFLTALFDNRNASNCTALVGQPIHWSGDKAGFMEALRASLEALRKSAPPQRWLADPPDPPPTTGAAASSAPSAPPSPDS